MSHDERLRNRMASIDGILDSYYESLDAYQLEIANSYSADAKVSLTKKIKRDVLPKIVQFETEYSALAVDLGLVDQLGDTEVSTAISDLTAALPRITIEISNIGSDTHVADNLQQVKTILNSMMSERGKLKAVLPIIPGIVYYEWNADASAFLKSIWTRLRNFLTP